MLPGLSSRFKSKRLLLRRHNSASGVSHSSSTSRPSEEGADAESSTGSGSQQQTQQLQPSQSQSIQQRPNRHVERGSQSAAKEASSSPPISTSSSARPPRGTIMDGGDALPGPRPKSTMSTDMKRWSAKYGWDAPECAEGCVNTAAGTTGQSSKISESSPESAHVATDVSESSAASSAPLAHFTLPAPPLVAPFSTLSPPVSPDPGPRSAPAGPSTGYSTSTDTQILHNQRLELQDRLKRLSHQDPLYFDPALLPSPSARDKNSSPGTCATPPTLHSIFENFSTEPFRKLRPPERYPGEHGDPYTDPRVHPLHAPIGTASSSSTAATSPPPAPSTSTRSRICQSPAAASCSFSEHPSRPPAAKRPSSGSGPAIRQVKTPPQAHFVLDPPPEFGIPSPPTMVNARKIWVRRPGASPTLITISEDDLVDDVRDIILRKYANSLGKTFDAPDLHLCVHPRDQKDRLLQPDEHMCRTLDNFFPGGQTVDDAILIDIPRRTPKASPHPVQLGHGQQQHHVPHTAAAIYYTDDGRPLESGEGYFPPVGALPSPHMPLAMPATAAHGAQPHSIAVIGSGHLPTIPSPGGLRPRGHREQTGRPRVARTHTSSSAMNGSHGNYSHDPVGMPPGTISVPMPSPGHEHVYSSSGRVGIPSPRMLETRSASSRPKRRPKNVDFAGSAVVAAVPPISILIVEDNPINLKLLEAFVKRLKVRWQTATNGREAVKKWRTGGFHLVLMDIQLPVMNGLEATREIRRLERVNSIGVFSSVPTTPQEELALELNDKDRLENRHHFKGPVIIVALTASSLQSDRHEALAAGCNDFLTKPVNFVWLERKVTEWGCMQALIDFDGWRAWKSFALAEEEANKKAAAAKSKAKKSRSSLAAQI